jgi:hypothetical protein
MLILRLPASEVSPGNFAPTPLQLVAKFGRYARRGFQTAALGIGHAAFSCAPSLDQYLELKVEATNSSLCLRSADPVQFHVKLTALYSDEDLHRLLPPCFPDNALERGEADLQEISA